MCEDFSSLVAASNCAAGRGSRRLCGTRSRADFRSAGESHQTGLNGSPTLSSRLQTLHHVPLETTSAPPRRLCCRNCWVWRGPTWTPGTLGWRRGARRTRGTCCGTCTTSRSSWRPTSRPAAAPPPSQASRRYSAVRSASSNPAGSESNRFSLVVYRAFERHDHGSASNAASAGVWWSRIREVPPSLQVVRKNNLLSLADYV